MAKTTKTNRPDSAYPIKSARGFLHKGLTKREAFAMAALEGYCASDRVDAPGEAAQEAVEAEDALIKALNAPS